MCIWYGISCEEGMNTLCVRNDIKILFTGYAHILHDYKHPKTSKYALLDG